MNYTGNDNLEIMKFAKHYNQFLVNSISSVIRKCNGKNILDFGAADGYFMQHVLKTNRSLHMFGVEVDVTSLEKCKQKNLQVYPDLKKFNKQFDVIYSLNTLEHIQNDYEALRLIYEKLSNKGRLYIYVPALMFLFSSMDKKVGHYRRYTQKDLKNKLAACGFEVEQIEYCDILGVLATCLYILKDKLSKNKKGNISKMSIVLYDNIFPISRLLDKLLFKYLMGKNLFVVAHKIPTASAHS